MKKWLVFLCVLFLASSVAGISGATTFSSGGDRLIETQNIDGGWGWPLSGTSAPNTAAPIAMGLLSAYEQTGDTAYLDAAISAGAFIRDVSPPHATGNGIFMHALSQATGDSQYANDVKTEFYDALAAGTYDRSGTLYDTAGYAQHILSARTAQGYGNLATWDLALAAVGAYRLGADTTAWIDVIEDAINAMDSDAYFDVIGLAGGVWALAELGVDFDPTSGAYAADDNLDDLAATLASYQIDGGGFAWNSGYVIPDDDNEAVQETAYAILALNAVDPAGYLSEILGASAYLSSVQLASGGWENYAGDGENNEVTGEALWGINTAEPVPEPGTMLLLGSGLLGLAGIRRKKFKP